MIQNAIFFLQNEHHDIKHDRKQKSGLGPLGPNVQLFMQQNSLRRSFSIGRRQDGSKLGDLDQSWSCLLLMAF